MVIEGSSIIKKASEGIIEGTFLRVTSTWLDWSDEYSKQLRYYFPEAYLFDSFNTRTLGNYSLIESSRYNKVSTIVNLYACGEVFYEHRNFDYRAFADCLEKIKHLCINRKIYYNALGVYQGGLWENIQPSIKRVLKNSEHYFINI